MIAWVQQIKTLNDTTVLLLFNDDLKPIGSLVEEGDDWLVAIEGREPHRMSGGGCPDPIDFAFKLTSPRNETQTNDEPLMSFTMSDGERWEVWEVL
jgi:hypothetical protein